MNRRKFLTLSVATVCTIPVMVSAIDYRAVNPAAWEAKTIDDAVKALYGDVQLIESSDVRLKIPKVTTNGGAVPVGIKTSMKAKSVSLFQNSNPESAVAVWTVREDDIVDYGLKLKIRTFADGSPSRVTVIVEGVDGKYYSTSALVSVKGGCE